MKNEWYINVKYRMGHVQNLEGIVFTLKKLLRMGMRIDIMFLNEV